ncbi:MAG TPA: VOC family protein [Candidatus Scybalocola faecavium]|nr:VOC family protein [Candidatus Scybalocola faecavium]
MIRGFSHIAFNMKNTEEMLHFYCDILGMKEKFTLTHKQAYDQLLKDHDGNIPEDLKDFEKFLQKMGDRKWLTYVEMAPHQFIEFFYQYDEKAPFPEASRTYGYQHFSLEVDDIHAMVDHLVAQGLVPDSYLSKGVDGTWQCWFHDPDGNPFELMEYTKDSMQLMEN